MMNELDMIYAEVKTHARKARFAEAQTLMDKAFHMNVKATLDSLANLIDDVAVLKNLHGLLLHEDAVETASKSLKYLVGIQKILELLRVKEPKN